MLLTKGIDDDIALVKGLKDEVQALKSRCNMLEKNVKNLLSICNTYGQSVETYQMKAINHLRQQGTLDLSYQGEPGEEFELTS
jgi:archaellum component FlaC